MNRNIIPKEYQIQQAIIDWSQYHPILKLYLICVENERKCSILQGVKRKRMGVKSGVSDLFLAYPSNGYHGLWVELKRNENAKVTIEQRAWIEKMNLIGYRAHIAYGFDHAVKIITEYLKQNPTHVK